MVVQLVGSIALLALSRRFGACERATGDEVALVAVLTVVAVGASVLAIMRGRGRPRHWHATVAELLTFPTFVALLVAWSGATYTGTCQD